MERWVFLAREAEHHTMKSMGSTRENVRLETATEKSHLSAICSNVGYMSLALKEVRQVHIVTSSSPVHYVTADTYRLALARKGIAATLEINDVRSASIDDIIHRTQGPLLIVVGNDAANTYLEKLQRSDGRAPAVLREGEYYGFTTHPIQTS